MATQDMVSRNRVNETEALRMILDGTATGTGEKFFHDLVENLARALHTQGAWVTEYKKEVRRLRSIAFWMNGKWLDGFEYDIDGTPCAPVVDNKRMVHVPDKVLELYAGDPDLRDSGAVSYLGIPLLDLDQEILGHIAVLDTSPMPEDPATIAVFRIFAARASAELQRLRVEQELREREQKLGRLVDSAMDAILELDGSMRVTQMNPAARNVFRCAEGQVLHEEFARFLTHESQQKLLELLQQLESRPEGKQYQWIPGGLRAVCTDGMEFAAEATLSRSFSKGGVFYTLILRNVNERIEAEKKIRSLTDETEYLKEEIRALKNLDEIIGKSPALIRVLHDVKQVADTNATVLIQGETGTGKELFARAIHAGSQRKERPLITVNCAAVPSTLIESEFFGHEPGAFTGATKKREGRFALADGGTIFLDEIGELPLDLQSKLLRVLQEGEFEPVGSSRTRKVDVRVIAATNRDLHKEVREGKFREDLYYRLNVFPIDLPPLRERKEDIPLLAWDFAQRFARRIGRSVDPISDHSSRRLQSYAWPGNVRELQNVMERAVITSREGQLNLDRALPEFREASVREDFVPEKGSARILTADELQDLERKNILKALETCGGRVAGKNGAASLLGMNPSTLSSRIKALGIRKKGL